MKNKTKTETKLWIRILFNVSLMFLIGVVLMWFSTLFLDVWTHHGESLTVPNVKGMKCQEAEEFLLSQGFSVEISDSIYSNAVKPGEVVEQNPKENTKVKEGREIYLTINAFSPRMVTIPSLVDRSLREASTVLEGLGITRVTVKYVPSEYQDLVLAVLRDNHYLQAGARVPVTAEIVLEVGQSVTNDSIGGDDLEADGIDQLDLF